MTESNDPPLWQLTYAGPAFNRPFLTIFKNYNPRNIKLGHPVQQPYCG